METLNWGKCAIFLKWLYAGETTGSEHAIFLPTGVSGETSLETTEGEETEALIEGGEVEAVRYSRNKYNLKTVIRTLKGRAKPINDTDGVISGGGSVMLFPEDITASGLYIEKASGRLVDSFNAGDGGRWAYNFKALKATSGDQCKWGTFTFTSKSGQTITTVEDITAAKVAKIEFTPLDGQTSDKVTVYEAAS